MCVLDEGVKVLKVVCVKVQGFGVLARVGLEDIDITLIWTSYQTGVIC